MVQLFSITNIDYLFDISKKNLQDIFVCRNRQFSGITSLTHSSSVSYDLNTPWSSR